MRVRYQRGYLRLGRRENGPDCWEFLWRDSELDRKPARRKAVIIQMWKIPGRLATIFVCLSMKHVLINPFCEPVCGALRRVRFRRYSVGTKQLAMSSDDGHQVAPGERQSLPCRTRYQVHTSKVCPAGEEHSAGWQRPSRSATGTRAFRDRRHTDSHRSKRSKNSSPPTVVRDCPYQ